MKFFRGLIIVEPHGDMILDGDKTVLIKAKEFISIIDKPLLLIQNKEALGIIKLAKSKPINISEFNELKNVHQITTKERKKWWPNKRILYAYNIKIIKQFAEPKKIRYPRGPQVVVKPENIKFL